MDNINHILQEHPLARLIQPESFVGWTYSVDYDTAYVMTNDSWKAQTLGIPHNSFLLAASFDPQAFGNTEHVDQEIILLRVVASAKLPQDDDLVRTKIDYFQQRTGIYEAEENRDIDPITLNQLQFGGLECRVLGTFYIDQDELWLGSDLESFAAASRLKVYRPHGDVLKTIVNYVDPNKRKSAEEDAIRLGFAGTIQPFQIGTVRYTSTDRLHRRDERAEIVPVYIQPSDFLARRTAVLGMTRTGKSNMIKQMVSVVKRVADDGNAKIGQIIYDINGEYANPNTIDLGALADIYPESTIRYRMIETPGFEELRTNFYDQLNDGFGIIQRELNSANRVTTDYVRAFVNMSLDEPDQKEQGEWNRWRVRVAAYKSLLYVAGFKAPSNQKVYFPASQAIQTQVNQQAGESFPNPDKGLSFDQAKDWFLTLREINLDTPLKSSSSGKPWVDDTLQTLLNMIAQKLSTGTYISGFSILADALKYHSPKRTREIGNEIYEHLENGMIVILDLSVGDATMREKLSKQIAQRIFQNSMNIFIEGKTPPNIVVYVEEANNLIGKGIDLMETWPRLAKEGAKYRIALVYATQEVSSMHPNILANTENWFITHLNNAREIRELAQFYDFDDFSRSLVRAQDVGFARVKTLSSPFVIPVQIDKFDPEIARQQTGTIND